MRITDINIDRFGVWRNLSLPLHAGGITVFYGPNEAGKSTLMRFVRGTLYGFNPEGQRINRAGLSTDGQGSLRILHDGNDHVVYREADAGQRGRVRVDDLDWGTLSENRVKAFLGGTSEAMFENVFAIGLQELQELATLDEDEIAGHVYGLSLGPDGERILRARDQFDRARNTLLSADHKSGKLVELSRRLAEIDRLLADVGDAGEKHQHLRNERERLTVEIDQVERRRTTLEANLRGYRFLERVHAPWSRERRLREEQSALPLPATFPDDGLRQFDSLSREIEVQKRKRSRLLNDARELYRKAGERSGDTTLLQHECTIRRLAEERDEMKQRERRLAELEANADRLKRRLESRMLPTGGARSADQPSESKSVASGLGRLMAASRAYQQALNRKGRAAKRYKKLAKSAQKRQALFNERIKSLGNTSLADAIKATRRRLSEVEELHQLRLEEARLTGRMQAPRKTRQVAVTPSGVMNFRDLPPLFYLVLWFFTGAGLCLFFCGLWWASHYNNVLGHTAWIVGAIYSCFGLCMAGVTWTVRQHFEQFFEGGLVGDGRFALKGNAFPQRIEQQPEADPDAERKLKRVRQQIADLLQRNAFPRIRQSDGQSAELSAADVLARTTKRLTDLELLSRDEERLPKDRKRLARYRDVLRQRQRDVGTRRREWCEVLRDLGLEETLKIDKAISQWQSILEADDLRREHATQLELIERDRTALEEHRRDRERLVGLLPMTYVVGLKSDPDGLLNHWLEELRNSGGLTDEQLRCRREGRQKRKEAARLEAKIRELNSKQHMLLMQAGAATRDDLEHRTESLLRRNELARLLDEAQLELQLAAEEEPDLAIVEDDLIAFDADATRQKISDCELELKQLDRDVQSAREDLGRVKRELSELLGDRRAVTLRFEREQVAAELREAMEQWCSLDLSIGSLDRIRHRIERHCQSDTLQLASKYLSQLTVGKYHNVWSPLGERHLCIDEDDGQTLTADQLSTGTREQLFLAIRLAMIRRMAQDGIELPLVLDDVFVNFDQHRTEAAVATIRDLADSGQQVLLFTCHLHLADLFEEQGIDAVWLPTQTERLEERRAG